MTYVSWKLSGFPKSRVVGVGANLDTERFRNILANLLKAQVLAKDAWIIGEQGEDKGKVILYEYIMSWQRLSN